MLLPAFFLFQVRVIAVVLRSEKVAYRCLFRCQEKQLLSNGVADIHTDHFGFAYGTADIMCPLPSGCETPSSIAVTSTDANSTSTVQNVNVAMAMLMAMPVCLSIWCLL